MLWDLDRDQFSAYDRRRSIIYDTRVGSYLPADPSRFIGSALAKGVPASEDAPSVIFAGETHTHPLHHLMQYEVIRGVNALDEQPVAIGLEMCYRQHQQALDNFVFGDGSFAALKARAMARPRLCTHPLIAPLPAPGAHALEDDVGVRSE